MSTSITINNYLNTISNSAKEDFKESINGDLFSFTFQNVNSSEKSSINNLHFSSRISSNNESDIKGIYNKIKIEVKEELDSVNVKEKGSSTFDKFNRTIDKIMDYPLDVKLDKDEVYTAILYSRMGINYLDVKRIEIKMELLNLAREEIEEQKDFMSKDKYQALIEKIDSNVLKLENMKQSILDGSEAKNREKLFLEKLMLS